jgi:hypothetical protein
MKNAVRELTKFSSVPTVRAQDAMFCAMKYVVSKPTRGLVLDPKGTLDGKDKNYKFVIAVHADSEFAKCIESRKSVGGYVTTLNSAPVAESCKMQNIVALSVTEADYISAALCVQEMVSHKCLLESLGLSVQLPMVLQIDNKGAIDLVDNWSCGGRTKHIDMRHYYMRELKEQGILKVVHIATNDNTSDIFTKNLMGPVFDKHASFFVGRDQFMDPEGESVGGGCHDCDVTSSGFLKGPTALLGLHIGTMDELSGCVGTIDWLEESEVPYRETSLDGSSDRVGVQLV